MNNEFTIVATADIDPDQLHQLYTSVGWTGYTNDLEALIRAVENSTYVVTAQTDDRLIGLARGMSDDVSVFYLQDILVRPDWQHRGVGRSLLGNCLDRFDHVRQKVLLTDDLPEQHRFYESLGYVDTRHISNLALHAFVQIRNVNLETEER